MRNCKTCWDKRVPAKRGTKGSGFLIFKVVRVFSRVCSQDLCSHFWCPAATLSPIPNSKVRDFLLNFLEKEFSNASSVNFSFWGGKFCGNFAGIFWTHRIKAQIFRAAIISEHFLSEVNLCSRIKSFVPTSFCRHATLEEDLELRIANTRPKLQTGSKTLRTK